MFDILRLINEIVRRLTKLTEQAVTTDGILNQLIFILQSESPDRIVWIQDIR